MEETEATHMEVGEVMELMEEIFMEVEEAMVEVMAETITVEEDLMDMVVGLKLTDYMEAEVGWKVDMAATEFV